MFSLGRRGVSQDCVLDEMVSLQSNRSLDQL